MPEPARSQSTSADKSVNWALLSRMVILVGMIMALIFYYAHLPAYYHFLLGPDGRNPAHLNWGPTQLQSLAAQTGQSVPTIAMLSTILFGLMTAVYSVVAFLLLLRKPQDRVAVITALTLVLFGTGFPPILNVVSAQRPELDRLLYLWGEGGFTILFILYLIFPDGRFRPRWTALLAVFWGIQPIVVTFWPESPLLVYTLPQPWGSIVPLVFLGMFALALVYRYLFLLTPLQRQQTKWAVTGMAFVLLLFLIFLAYYYSRPELKENTPEAAMVELLAISALTMIFTIIPITLGIAITRHRLWEIDLIIRRTLSYSIVTAALLTIYFGVVIIVQVLTERVLNLQNSQIATVISTLTIAALFNPLRRRIQVGIDRRFNRRKFDSMASVAGFSSRMGSEVELTTITTEIQNLVQHAIQPRTIAIWIKEGPQRTQRVPGRNVSETSRS